MQTAKIDELVPGGQGIATLENGKKAFIWNALPGEIVEFEVTKDKKSYCEGIAQNIRQTSPQRVAPHDDCYLATSPWQIFNYRYELEQKTELVKKCLAQNHLIFDVQPTITDGKDYFYRNKMEYSLYWDNAAAKIFPAFHERNSHRKQPITHSSLEHSEIFAAATSAIAELNAKHAEARAYQSLLIRCDQAGQTSTALFENGKPHPKMALLSDQLNGYTYNYSPNGFFQINLPVYELALKTIAEHLQADQVLDLYAGVGSIGLSVARDAKNLTLVEVDHAAFNELEHNAAGLPNTHCILDKSENVTSYLAPNCTVILDPPRAGCDVKLLEAINQILPRTLIYLSCNPITQARDLAILRTHYQIDLLQPFNFFPHTPHIENLAVLTCQSD